MGRPRLYESGIYLKLADQGLIEPIGVWRNVDTKIKGISTKVNFEIIDPKEGSNFFPALLGQPWGRKMKESIYLEKERIKLKGNGQKVIVPIHPSQGEPWIEPIDEEVDIRQLYQIQNNEDYTEPNIYGELHLGNQDSIGYNSNAESYDWEVENYETQARNCWTIQAIYKKATHQCFSVSIIPKIFKRKTREYYLNPNKYKYQEKPKV